MKLIIQVPCLNEERHLPVALAALPRQVPGFDRVEWLVIDDGSTDRTAEVAQAHGADHVIRFRTNRGLARAFMAGLEAALKLGADVIVNTDADNQYDAAGIADLVRPIIEGRAELVVGTRPIADIAHFSPVKKLLQRWGSRVVGLASGVEVPDATSGFRAIHRDAAIRLNVYNDYTYTLETLIQAGRNKIPVVAVPIAVNADLRPSRLVRGNFDYVVRSIVTMLRVFVIYKPLRFFGFLALIAAAPGVFGILRFLALTAMGGGGGHVQSLVISGSVIVVAAALAVSGLMADQAAANRALLEDLRVRALRAEIAAARPSIGTTSPGT